MSSELECVVLLTSCVERRPSAVGSGNDNELLESLLLLPPPLEAEEAELERSGPPNLLPRRLRECSSRGPERERVATKMDSSSACRSSSTYAVPDSAVGSDPI